jgi:glucose-6-phosphate 1-epimerase
MPGITDAHTVMHMPATRQGGSAEVYLHGAHVTSWKSAAGEVRTRRWSIERVSRRFSRANERQTHRRTLRRAARAPQELIFVSSKAVFKPPKAIRGGVPVCFPQFGGFGPLAQHGFARNSAFEVAGGGADTVTLALRPSPEQLKLFPHDFLLKVTARCHCCAARPRPRSPAAPQAVLAALQHSQPGSGALQAPG